MRGDHPAAAPQVIRVGIAHAAAMAAIHATGFPPAERWDVAAFAATLALPGALGLVASGGEVPGGMALARLAADECELLALAVLPARQRRGLGAGLLRAAMAHARRGAATTMFLEVKDSNAAALALYRRAGFVAVGRRRKYYADGADALVLRAALAVDGGDAAGVKPCG